MTLVRCLHFVFIRLALPIGLVKLFGEVAICYCILLVLVWFFMCIDLVFLFAFQRDGQRDGQSDRDSWPID
jgi:hypothetical protein